MKYIILLLIILMFSSCATTVDYGYQPYPQYRTYRHYGPYRRPVVIHQYPYRTYRSSPNRYRQQPSHRMNGNRGYNNHRPSPSRRR